MLARYYSIRFPVTKSFAAINNLRTLTKRNPLRDMALSMFACITAILPLLVLSGKAGNQIAALGIDVLVNGFIPDLVLRMIFSDASGDQLRAPALNDLLTDEISGRFVLKPRSLVRFPITDY